MQKTMRHPVLKWLWIMAALALIAVSINMFYAPHAVAAGGATGIAILVQEVAGIQIGLTTMAVNLLMLGLAWFFLDRSTLKRILFGSFMLPLLLWITPEINLVTDRLLAIIVGSVVFAFGVGLLYQMDASSGGTTVPPLIFKKYFGLKPSVMLLITDVIVSLFNIPVSGVEAFILAVFALTITSLVMNYVETGFDRKKAVYIMSDQLDMLKQRIRDETPHGLTVQPVVGGFSDENREMLMVVVEQSDFRRLIELIHGIDPDAFILTVAATEVHGGSI
ncbi:YitT family protein [Lacticaseibacillus rhamnosus]|uniref:YitT family protein n=1 Tax=Lacticaseibacillus rhamnosus TaxID=47715 RepID=UPI0021A90361|nr:YitT family protein [Lacticaseibacillus rhamnosus]